MICKKCSAEIPDDGLFCPDCGARNDGLRICPNCKKLIKEGSSFCTYCGTRASENKPASVEPETKKEQPQEVSKTTASDVVPNETANISNTQNAKISDEKSTSNSAEKGNEDTSSTVVSVENNIETKNGTPKTGADDNENIFFELPKTMDEKTFYANALAEIALDKNSPVDIFSAGKFEPIKLIYRQYALGSGTAQMSYAATVGYDHKEKYYENGKEKTRTVTDWKPFSGTYTGEYLNAVANDKNEDYWDAWDYSDHCMDKAKAYNASTSKAPAPLVPSSASISSLKSGIEGSAHADCKKQLPGDRHKDFKANGIVTLNWVESHVAPQYILKYKYLNADYTLKAHTVKESRIRGDIPSAQSKIESEIEGRPLVAAFNIITLIALVVSIVSSILFPLVFKLIFGGVGIALFVTSCIIKSKVSKGIYQRKTVQKKLDLIAHLKKKGIAIPNSLNGGL